MRRQVLSARCVMPARSKRAFVATTRVTPFASRFAGSLSVSRRSSSLVLARLHASRRDPPLSSKVRRASICISRNCMQGVVGNAGVKQPHSGRLATADAELPSLSYGHLVGDSIDPASGEIRAPLLASLAERLASDDVADVSDQQPQQRPSQQDERERVGSQHTQRRMGTGRTSKPEDHQHRTHEADHESPRPESAKRRDPSDHTAEQRSDDARTAAEG
jgi:hypothetical protein